MSETSAAHRALLERIASRLGGKGLRAALRPASDAVPFEILGVAVPATAAGQPPWEIDLAFTPGVERELETSSLLQCFATLPLQVGADREAALWQEIFRLNALLPLPGLGWMEATRSAYFRHVLLVPNDAPEVTLALAEEAVWMTGYLLETCVPALAKALR
jgi:hypothetical protein